jgi:hypothetical protein
MKLKLLFEITKLQYEKVWYWGLFIFIFLSQIPYEDIYINKNIEFSRTPIYSEIFILYKKYLLYAKSCQLCCWYLNLHFTHS